MPFANEKLEGKNRLLALLDPEHDIELESTFLNYLASAIRASSPSQRQQSLDKATEAYENALDDVLYEHGGDLAPKSRARRPKSAALVRR